MPPTSQNSETQQEGQATPRKRNAVQPGGYPPEIFIELSNDERDRYRCNICLDMMKDGVQCKNGHIFCKGCVQEWNKTKTGFKTKATQCPVCRKLGTYTICPLDVTLKRKTVTCSKEGCDWVGTLTDLDQHISSGCGSSESKDTKSSDDKSAAEPANKKNKPDQEDRDQNENSDSASTSESSSSVASPRRSTRLAASGSAAIDATTATVAATAAESGISNTAPRRSSRLANKNTNSTMAGRRKRTRSTSDYSPETASQKKK